MEVKSTTVVCSKCGKMFGGRKNNFYKSYAAQYKGTGYLHICKECVDAMYNTYLAQCGDAKQAVRQMCRKLDLYWNETLFEGAYRKSTPHSIMASYIAKINITSQVGKSYDDTLSSEGDLWNTGQDVNTTLLDNIQEEDITVSDEVEEKETIEIPQEVIDFWGTGYSDDMYLELEQRRQYWMSRFPDGIQLDIGTEALIRQICALELDINRDRLAGKPIDKNVNTLNTLLGSANLKPNQQKNDSSDIYENTPFGVWINRWETKRPIPETDPELRDVDGIIRYITIWFFGHLCKMLGIKNTYCKLYEQEIERLRVAHPEYEDEDDETLFDSVFSVNDENEEETTEVVGDE